MDYDTYLGSYVSEPRLKQDEPIKYAHNALMNSVQQYKRPRLGVPSGFLSYEEHKKDIEKIIDIFVKDGYWGIIPTNINVNVARHLWYFRSCLEIYDAIVPNKVFCRDEIYWNTLTERENFTKYIKKCRHFSLQAKTCHGDYDIPDEYIHEEYDGYDSIIHERYLINWSEEPEDYLYAFLDPTPYDEEAFAESVNYLLKVSNIIDYAYPDKINLIEPIANKKSALNTQKGEVTLLKDTYTNVEIEERGSWMGTRRIVPMAPGNVRDTAVPDFQTLVHLKLLHLHARKVSEKCPYSANCPLKSLDERLRVVQKSEWFLHLDFKKFGLTAQRALANQFLEAIGKGHLRIPKCYLIEAEEVYETLRGGGALGWCDPLFGLCVCAILLDFKKSHKLKDMKFINFMDDIEIGFGRRPAEEIEIFKDMICKDLEDYGFFISYRKTYISRMSIFLENYHNGEFYNLDMRKLQLCVQMFAKSLVSEHSFKAKFYYSEGSKYIDSPFIRELCMNSIDPIFPEEYEKPVILGGWLRPINHVNGLDLSLENATLNELEFLDRISKYKEPHLMPKTVDVTFVQVKRRKEKLIKNGTVRKFINISKLEFDPSPEFSEEDYHRLQTLALWNRMEDREALPGIAGSAIGPEEIDPG